MKAFAQFIFTVWMAAAALALFGILINLVHG
jgi:hypothetical protein